MRVEAALELARQGRLYPSTILHGGRFESRLEVAQRLARALLCEAPAEERPCDRCRHCRRILAGEPAANAEAAEQPFHPDFRLLRRDLKTATSVDATRELLRMTQQHPFEARGQVLVVAEAETLSGEAANALLKTLEEPPEGAPRHFLLLAPAREDLLATLRSRSWAVYLGAADRLAEQEVAELATQLARAVAAWRQSGAGIYLLLASAALERAGGWDDPRAQRPWATAAAAAARAAAEQRTPEVRRRLLALAHDLLEAPRWRLRGISPQRILDGLVARHLAP